LKNQIKIYEKIKPFNKKIFVSGDKSLSIRCILLSSIAIGKSKIYNILKSEDTFSALKAIKKLGVSYIFKKNYLEIYGVGINGFNNKNITINAGNSGTLARCIIGLCSGNNQKIKLVGDKSLSKRDFSRIVEPIKLFGVNIKSNKNLLPLEFKGTNLLRPISYIENRGSAQIKTSIILSALNTIGTTKIKAKKSRDHTEVLLKYLNYPIKIKKTKIYDIIEIKGLSNFKAFKYNVPGDISSAAFFIVLTLLSENSELIVKNILVNPSRVGIITILKKMNAKISIINKKKYNGELIGDIRIKSTKNLNSVNCPENLNSSAIDEFLLIFLVAARSKGISKFKNLDELNKKESPRLDIAINFLRMLGVKVLRQNSNISIFGNPNLKLKNKFHIKNFMKDHRVFMMSVIAALTIGGEYWINDRDSIKTSFPNFLNIIKKLGAKIN
tara:strand:+ start:230 stop:1552 length:1323 start_codon:yes stop_codon:yes gene_type:complete